jgi:hypothetical protein
MSQYTAFEKFFSPEQAEPVLAILKEHNITYEFLKIGKVVDAMIAGETLNYNYELKIARNQFEYVNQLLLDKIQINLDDVDPEYYLFSFSDDELVEILRKPDEWGRQDYIIARQLLKSRGINYADEDLTYLKNKRLEILARPEKEGKGWIYAGYFFAAFGGFFGVLIGLALWQSTKVLPNGNKVYTYDQKTRNRGRLIMYVALIVFGLSIALRLTRAYEFFTNVSIYERPVINYNN